MTTLTDYGAVFRAAYAALHGGRPDEPPDTATRKPGESLEEFLARTRTEALGRVRRQLDSVEPPPALRRVHELLLQLLDGAREADAALAAQVEAYRCGQFSDSIAHSERLQALVATSTRLDRELIVALRELEEANAGTLDALGIAEVPQPPIAAEDAEDYV